MTEAFKRIAVCFVLAVSFSSIGQAQAEPVPEVPAIITHGLDTLARGGFAATLSLWGEGSPTLRDSSSRAALVSNLAPVLAAYGKPTGGEVIGVAFLGSRVERVYFTMYFEHGALFGYADAYQASNGWLVFGLLTNTRPQEVFPEGLVRITQLVDPAHSVRR